ncbi:MAG TPA: PilT/PilU family type 4a pilus ATPase [Verrucomicrobiae bacterium]|nr:PilT/PilU family type 4a pilus ATPase [Verrucomicrobiae bacterium]
MTAGATMTKEAVDALLRGMLESQAGVSDLLFVVGRPPQVEAHGKLKPVPNLLPGAALTPTQTEQLGRYLMAAIERLAHDFSSFGSCDCSYTVEGLARFRVNIFKQNGNYALVLRKLASEIPSLDKLALPAVFKDVIKERTGIVFVTGGTGSGKTTTLAALLNELNLKEAFHIVTLEDPIEFLHPHLNCTFSQRELGKDFHDFATGLKAALRQAPKVILVGEIRDRETMEIAMTASETGHVVFSTLHTINAGQTINRIVGMFSKDEEKQLRQRLADTVRYIVSQRLVSRVGGGRILMTELMGSNLRTREVILYGESENRTFQDIIESASTFGWHTFDQSLLKAFQADLITEETAMTYCAHKNKMGRDIDMTKKLRKADYSESSGLRMAGPMAA